jgi:hypothetical protein
MNERPNVTPNAEQRLSAGLTMAAAQLTAWGIMRVLHFTALALIAFGAILPIATTETTSIRFYDLGLGGWLTIFLGILLAGAPRALTMTHRVSAVGFGLICVAFGMLLLPWLYTGSVGQLSLGYYCLALGFGLLIIGYWHRMYDGPPLPLTQNIANATDNLADRQ